MLIVEADINEFVCVELKKPLGVSAEDVTVEVLLPKFPEAVDKDVPIIALSDVTVLLENPSKELEEADIIPLVAVVTLD